MITTIDIKVNAAHPNMPLPPSAVLNGSAATFRVIDVPKPVGKQAVTSVAVTVTNADGVAVSAECVRTGGCWVGTIPGSHFATDGFVGGGVLVSASGTDENGEAVTDWKLGLGDIAILAADGSVVPGETRITMYWFAEQPSAPKEGYMSVVDGVVCLYTNGEWKPLGGGSSSVSWDDITDKPTAFPPEAHSHASDNWFTTAIEAVKTWASGAFAAITHTHSRFDITSFAHAMSHSSLGGDPLDPSSIGALPADGGTMTGNLVVRKSGGGSSVTVVDGTGSSASSMTLNVDGLVAGNGDHYYVPGGGGTLALVESIPDVIDPASATTAGSAADALATKTALEGKLDKSGGTVTGGVEFKVGDSMVLDTSVRYLVGDWYVRFGNLSLEAPTSDSHAVRLADLAAYLADNTANYSASATYAVGAFVKYNRALYCCKTAITTAEEWTPAHWTAMPGVSSLFSSANTALMSLIRNNSAQLALDDQGEIVVTMNTED